MGSGGDAKRAERLSLGPRIVAPVDVSPARRDDTPGGARTPNPQIRSLMLYPVELRAQVPEMIQGHEPRH